jgi:hypothetical protein
MSQNCPICNATVQENPRWPRYLCGTCARKTTDKEGRRVTFGNVDFAGGLEGGYLDNNEKYNSDFCFVDGTRCKANEGKFGGVYIQTLSHEENELLDTLEELNVFIPFAERLATAFQRASISNEVEKEIEELLSDPFFGEGGLGVREALLLLISNFKNIE